MSHSDAAAEATVERLKREIARDRARIEFAKQFAEETEPAESSRVGRLFKVMEAMGQAP